LIGWWPRQVFERIFAVAMPSYIFRREPPSGLQLSQKNRSSADGGSCGRWCFQASGCQVQRTLGGPTASQTRQLFTTSMIKQQNAIRDGGKTILQQLVQIAAARVEDARPFELPLPLALRSPSSETQCP